MRFRTLRRRRSCTRDDEGVVAILVKLIRQARELAFRMKQADPAPFADLDNTLQELHQLILELRGHLERHARDTLRDGLESSPGRFREDREVVREPICVECRDLSVGKIGLHLPEQVEHAQRRPAACMIFQDLDDGMGKGPIEVCTPYMAVNGELVPGARGDHDRTRAHDPLLDRSEDVSRHRATPKRPAIAGVQDDQKLLAGETRPQYSLELLGPDRKPTFILVAAVATPLGEQQAQLASTGDHRMARE